MRVSALLVILAAACGGPPCRDPASARELIDKRRGPVPATAAPHGELILPHHQLDRLLAEALPAVEPVQLPLPPALRLLGLPAIELAATRVTVEPAGAGKIAAAIDLVASLGVAKLPLGAVTVEATPALMTVGRRQTLVISFAGDAIRRIDPSPAHRAIWADSYRRLPGAIRDRLPPLQFVAAVELLARHLGDAGFALLRRHLLSRIEEVTRISVTLPDLPLARTAVRTRTGGLPALVVELWTHLPVAAGIDPTDRRAPPATTAQLRLAAETVAEIANWAIATGRAPRRHDRDLNPRPDGAYFPMLGWRRGDRRPLEIHVFRFERPCSVIRVAARPEITSAAGEVKVGIRDGVIERVEGSPAVKLGVWASRLFEGAIDKSRSLASTTTTRVGRLTLTSTVRRAELRGDTVILGIDLAARPASP